MEKKQFRSILGLIVCAGLVALAVMHMETLVRATAQLTGLFKPVILGFVLAFLLNRPCQAFLRLYRRVLGKKLGERLGRPLAIASAYLSLILVLVLLVSFVIPQVVESGRLFMGSLSGYLANLATLAEELFRDLHLDPSWLEGIEIPELTVYLKNALEHLIQGIGSTLMGVMAFTGNLIAHIITGVMAVIFSIYMLGGRETLLSQSRRTLRAYLPQKAADRVLEVVHLSADTFTRFVSGQLLEACILGGLCACGMLFIHADYAPLIGIIIGVSALVPVAGAYIGALLAAFLLVMVSPMKALGFLVFLVLLQQFEGNVIYPRVVGSSIGLPGIWVLTAVTVGGGLFGLTGILLSVPVASVVYTLLREDVHRRLDPKAE